MAASAKHPSRAGHEQTRLRLLPALLAPLSALEEEALVEALALALLPLLVSGESSPPDAAPDKVVVGGELGAGCDL